LMNPLNVAARYIPAADAGLIRNHYKRITGFIQTAESRCSSGKQPHAFGIF